MDANAASLAAELAKEDALELVPGEPRLPLVIARVRAEEPFTGRDLVGELSRLRGWMVPAYGMPPDNEDQQILRMLVKVNQTRELVDALVSDFHDSIAYLRQHAAGKAPEKAVHTGHGY
jgi:glutamate decarboxylase